MRNHMKILGTELFINMDVLNEEWAQRNHGQSLERLNERGGLSVEEIMAIVERRRVRYSSVFTNTIDFLDCIKKTLDAKEDASNG